ncbi:MAG: hypothetical protein QM736_18140 [Vicinamibacterales bacterium]
MRRNPEPGYVGGMVQDAAYPPGYLLGWTPGQQPRPSPDDMPWRLDAGSDLIVQLHLQPTGRPEAIRISVGFFFTDTPPVRTPVGLRMGSETIDIAPGDGNYAITDSYVLPVDASVIALQPHAHNLGREMVAEATLPDGSTRPLIEIHDWDFRWQDVYRYAEPIALPKGSTIRMRFTYDNSAGNPRNPFQPPQRILWGQNTTDEMGDLWIQLVSARKEDTGVLAADIAKKTRGEDIAAYTRVLKTESREPVATRCGRDAVPPGWSAARGVAVLPRVAAPQCGVGAHALQLRHRALDAASVSGCNARVPRPRCVSTRTMRMRTTTLVRCCTWQGVSTRLRSITARRWSCGRITRKPAATSDVCSICRASRPTPRRNSRRRCV